MGDRLGNAETGWRLRRVVLCCAVLVGAVAIADGLLWRQASQSLAQHAALAEAARPAGEVVRELVRLDGLGRGMLAAAAPEAVDGQRVHALAARFTAAAARLQGLLALGAREASWARVKAAYQSLMPRVDRHEREIRDALALRLSGRDDAAPSLAGREGLALRMAAMREEAAQLQAGLLRQAQLCAVHCGQAAATARLVLLASLVLTGGLACLLAWLSLRGAAGWSSPRIFHLARRLAG